MWYCWWFPKWKFLVLLMEIVFSPPNFEQLKCRYCSNGLGLGKHLYMTWLTLHTQQDSDEDWFRVSEGRTVAVLQLCCRRSGEDSGESKTGSVYPQHHAVTRSHSNHQLHYLCSPACPVLAVWAPWAEHVWTRSNTYVLTFSILKFRRWNRFFNVPSYLFIFYICFSGWCSSVLLQNSQQFVLSGNQSKHLCWKV